MSPTAPYGVGGPFLYPLWTAYVVAPFRALGSAQLAAAVFEATSAFALTYVLTSRGWLALAMLVAPPFYWSIKTANWPVLLVAAAVTPGAGWLGALKPNLGLVVLAYRPERATFIGGLVLLVGSLLASPAWPAEWLTHVKAQPVAHLSAIFWPAGAIGLLGILRWRTPEGRSLLALSLTPTASLPYDWLMLWLVCRTGREFVALTVASWFTWLAVLATAPHDLTRAWTAGHFILAVGWLGTAAAIVLRRRNAPPKLQQVNRPT